jgi:hypothetical protein
VACAGYFSLFNKTAKIVLERSSGDDGSKDIPGLIAILGVNLSVIVAFPLSWNPTRSQVVI